MLDSCFAGSTPVLSNISRNIKMKAIGCKRIPQVRYLRFRETAFGIARFWNKGEGVLLQHIFECSVNKIARGDSHFLKLSAGLIEERIRNAC